MFRRLPVAGKLTLALLPLIVAVVALGGIFAYQTYESVEGDRVSARAANALLEADQTLGAIDLELQLGLETTAGKVVDLTEARQSVDEGIRRLEASLVGVPIMAGAPFETIQQHLVMARADLDNQQLDGASLFRHYEMVVGPILGIADSLPSVANDRALFLDLSGLRSVIDVRHHMALQQLFVLDVVSGRSQITNNAPLEFLRIADQTELIDRSMSEFLSANPGRWDGRTGDLATDGRMAESADLVAQLANAGEAGLESSPIGIIEWISRLDGRQDRISVLAGEVANSAIGTAQANAAEAQQRVILIAGGTALVVLFTILLTSLVARSVARRIRQVAERARLVSEVQIPTLMEALENPREEVDLPQPDPIRDSSKDELGELSRSFNTMQVTIDDVARRQIVALRKGVAEIFVSLARRNRGLIDRQLAVIDDLEREEADPATLADLYRLDHLATRMRRNAENLLVLAGTETPRRWSQPVSLDDCVRAAIGEVEEYRRVDILNLEPIAVKGGAVTDLSHLLAELIDNATAFSPPQTRVRIAGYFDTSGYLITVADSGVGLGQVKLAEVNELLEQPPVIGLALEPTLGLYVVARLARRHGIDVRLVKGAPGVTAQVRIPASLYEAVTRSPSYGGELTNDAPVATPAFRIESAKPDDQVNGHGGFVAEPRDEETEPTPTPLVPRNGAIAARLRKRSASPFKRSDPGADPAPQEHVGDAPDRGDALDETRGEELPVETADALGRLPQAPPATVASPHKQSVGSPEHQPVPTVAEPAQLTEAGLPMRTRAAASEVIEAIDDGVGRSERSAHGLRTAFSQFQHGAEIARRGTTEDNE